jgi:hypothetical protein
MLLRRVIEHVRDQNWTAVGIDFLIVVIGVFVGIQVANWNAARADELRARGYLERIRDDLDADLAGNGDRLAFSRQVAAYGTQGLAYAETGDAGGASQWELLLAYFQASQVASLIVNQTTHDELKSAGELRLIANAALRKRIAQYYAQGVPPSAQERPAYRLSVRARIPLEIQRHVWRQCYRAEDETQRLLPCTPPVGEDEARAVVDALRRDAELMGELRYWMSTLEVAALLGESRLAIARALRADIDASLGGPIDTAR